jgi:hypothetical protein
MQAIAHSTATAVADPLYFAKKTTMKIRISPKTGQSEPQADPDRVDKGPLLSFESAGFSQFIDLD